MKPLLILPALIVLFNYCALGQMKVDTGKNIDLAFNKNVELVGFAYFLGFEGKEIESKVLEIEGRHVPKKEWHSYGYSFYKAYKSHQNSTNLQKAFAVADHLWLDEIIYLVLQLDEVPNAVLHDKIVPSAYLSFSKTKNPEEARKNVEIFLDGLNQFSVEVNFDNYLSVSQPYYAKALREVQNSLGTNRYIHHLEEYFGKGFVSYNLVPSLTLPKGMGFGLQYKQQDVYNVFAAGDWQEITTLDSLNMGFMNAQKTRELSIHEFGHSFVNPVVAKLPDSLFKSTEILFKPIEEKIYSQGYNTWKACMYEHFTRAVELLLSEQYDTPAAYNTLSKEYIEDRQFIYIPIIIQALKDAKEARQPFEVAVKNSMQELSKLVREEKDTACRLNWHIEDVTRFWEVYDQSSDGFKGKIWQESYIDKGSIGLQAFIPNRIESGKKLAKTLKKDQVYYEAVRASTIDLANEKVAVCAIYSKLDSLYPEAQFPAIYFVMGRRNTGGTVFNGGIVIGIERFGTPTENFLPDLDTKDLNVLIAHELIHFQQNYVRDNSLLAQSIREGAGDFLGELLSGYKVDSESHLYGNAHEAELKAEFKERMHSNNWSGWLYYSKDKSRPKDLGYWMGYQICKSYYNQKVDKKQAIYEILNIKNFRSFLESSNYLSVK